MRNDLTDITILLDRSGSMESVRAATIEAVNGYIGSQDNGVGSAVVTLIQFDGVHGDAPNGEPGFWQVYSAKPVAEAPKLSMETYRPRGDTPLLDSIGRAITSTGSRMEQTPEADRPATVLFVIQTDGAENASREFTLDRVREMIAHQRDKYGWQFVFLGAGIDAISSAASLGIRAAQAMSYGKTAKGTSEAFSSVARSTAQLRSAKLAGNSDAEYRVDENDRSKVAN